MLFKSIKPDPALEHVVKEYWIIKDEDSDPVQRKIIPDGYPELIFHYGDPYQIRLHQEWEPQALSLFAGQISKFFYLKNTGRSGMFGIKLMPAAVHKLYDVDMPAFTDRVVPLQEALGNGGDELEKEIRLAKSLAGKVRAAESCLLALIDMIPLENSWLIQQAVNLILSKKGLVRIEEISSELEVSRRHLERTFKRAIGLTPKFYSRIIRFNYIFEIMKAGNDSWVQIALDSGYFDQSHFIKEFKAFSGEDPSGYGFDQQTIANFFLKKE